MTTPIWQYHEPDHPGSDFDALAEIYDRNMQKYRDIQGEIKEIMDFLDLKSDQTVLEIGTGTGEFALAAAGHCRKVYAVDLSAGMLKYARKKAESRDIDNVEFLTGGFLTYQHQGAPLDCVVSQIALHHLPDFWKQIALLRIAGMLKEGGRFCLRDVVYSFEISEYKDYFTKFISQASIRCGDEFAHLMSNHVKNEYSTMDWIMERMIDRAGFEQTKAKKEHGFLDRKSVV